MPVMPAYTTYYAPTVAYYAPTVAYYAPTPTVVYYAAPHIRDVLCWADRCRLWRLLCAADGTIDTALSVIIGRGTGLAFSLGDDKIPPDAVLDDQAEIILGGHTFPAVAFTVGSETLALHPGDAAGVLAALGKTGTLRLRSDGGGVDTGAITLDLPGGVLGWLKQCGRQFDIAIDQPTDPNAGDLPVPRPRSPEIASSRPTTAGPAGIEDKQKISGWDASELRGPEGNVLVCMIRRHYATGSEPGARRIGTFLMVAAPRD